jgi:hypothetical protein
VNNEERRMVVRLRVEGETLESQLRDTRRSAYNWRHISFLLAAINLGLIAGIIHSNVT